MTLEERDEIIEDIENILLLHGIAPGTIEFEDWSDEDLDSFEVEAFFANTFAEILDLDNVSVTDSFFEIGGTSLLVTKITLAALERDYEVNYGDVFKNPTPRMLADFILEESGSETSDESRYDYSKINRYIMQW